MADEEEFKIKGAASRHAEVDSTTSQADETAAPVDEESSHDGVKAKPNNDATETEEIEKTKLQEQHHQDQLKRYRWCKCICDPSQYGRDHYFLHMDNQQSRWEEPSEPYWTWNAEKQAVDEDSLQQPHTATSVPGSGAHTSAGGVDPDYMGYNPKIHGSYDPNAPYAQYHNQKREEEALASQSTFGVTPQASVAAPVIAGAFNRFTGSFQSADLSTERHNDFNKSGRQMNAFFDVDAAANSHNGRSLKEERRNEKLSKSQIREMAAQRKAKKEKKRLDFYKS